MGIYINLLVSNGVTQEEWTKAYEETLSLLDKLHLVERRECDIHGVKCGLPCSKHGACHDMGVE